MLKDGWRGRYYEDFEVGDLYRHRLGRTVTETDNTLFTMLTLNTNPIHFDENLASKTPFGKILVNSCFTLSLAVGLSVADLSEHVMANLQWNDVRLPNPVFIGDTIYASSEILEQAGIVLAAGRWDRDRANDRRQPARRDGHLLRPHVHGVQARKRPARRDRAIGSPMRPLADLRILAVEQFGAGPFGSVQLAELGADVIKIEDPRTGGDVSRSVPPYQSGEDSLFFETFNHDKRSLALDLNAAAGRAIFEDLVRVSDAVYSNLRGDGPAKLRLRYADLAPLNPRIVCVSLSGFGMTGPRRDEPAYDYILQGLAGWQSLTGAPDGPPTKSGLSLVDYSGGLVAALALLGPSTPRAVTASAATATPRCSIPP